MPNAWFVGMAPRRNPDIVVAVLWEHGNWGNNSAKLASQVINAYVTKQRAKEHNLKIAEVVVPEPVQPEAKEPEGTDDKPAAASKPETVPAKTRPVVKPGFLGKTSPAAKPVPSTTSLPQ